MPQLLRYGAADSAASSGGPLCILVVDLYDKLWILRTYSKPNLFKKKILKNPKPKNEVGW